MGYGERTVIPLLSMVLIIVGAGGLLLAVATALVGAVQGQGSPMAVLRPLGIGCALFVGGLLIPVDAEPNFSDDPQYAPMVPGSDPAAMPDMAPGPIHEIRGHLKPSLQVETRLRKACITSAEGIAQCWGEPSPVDEMAIVDITLGREHGCVLRKNGMADCWGDSLEGTVQPRRRTFDQIEAGLEFTCGREGSGTVLCWGIAPPTPPPGIRFAQISAGPDFVCGRTDAGDARCFGCGKTAVCAPAEGQFTDISAGDTHACGVRPTGELACWGNDRAGQSTAPTGRYQTVSAGWSHSCAITASGTLDCWGCKGRMSTLMPELESQCSPPDGRFAAVSAGGIWSSCAIDTAGTPHCWGGLARIEEPK